MSSEAIKAYDEFERQISGRTPDEIRAQAQKILDAAISGAVFGTSAAGAAAGVLPKSAPMTPAKKGVKIDHAARIAAFLVLNGAFSEARCWISTGQEGSYVMYPALLLKGAKGAAQWALAKEMAALIKAGKRSNMIKFLDSTSTGYSSKTSRYLFAKGYTLADDRAEALAMKADLDAIIAQMVANKGKGARQSFGAKLTYFN